MYWSLRGPNLFPNTLIGYLKMSVHPSQWEPLCSGPYVYLHPQAYRHTDRLMQEHTLTYTHADMHECIHAYTHIKIL